MANYHPAFVTETDEQFWTDCTWASAVMFIDAWTLGAVIVDREKLRAASGDTVGGSNLGDVARGMDNLLPDLPNLYRPSSWTASDAITYLRNGGTLIAQGLYSSIRTYDDGKYVRWDRAFANKGADSGHAVHVTDFVRVAGVDYVYWQDPLGRGTYRGEWVPSTVLLWFLNSLRRSNGSVRVAAAKVGAAGVLPDTSTGDEPLSIYNRNPRTGIFLIAADHAVKGYKPVGSDWVVEKTWAPRDTVSSASFSAHLSRLVGDTTPSSLLEVTSGFFDGLYVSTAEVTERFDPDPTPYSQDDIDEALSQQAAVLEAAQLSLANEKTKSAALSLALSKALIKAKELVSALTL